MTEHPLPCHWVVISGCSCCRCPGVINYSGRRHALRKSHVSSFRIISSKASISSPRYCDRILICGIMMMLYRRAFLTSSNINDTWTPKLVCILKLKVWVNYAARKECVTDRSDSVNVYGTDCLIFQTFFRTTLA